LVRAVAF